MKSFVSTLGMATAALTLAGAANAADLPSRKAAPVEYVKVCSAHGTGFFYIPGTDTCLRIGGRVRAEYAIGSRYGDAADGYGTRARGRLNVDARTATAYGTLRTFFRYELTSNTGVYSNTIVNPGINAPGAARGGSPATSQTLDLAFIQFGPITAGRAQSFFDFYANDLTFTSVRTADAKANLLAYTATFGSGFSATISLEDSAVTGRENYPGAFAVAQLGRNYPDLVASLRVDQAWGSAQLSGAIGERSVNNAGLGIRNEDEYVFAIQGGVKVNLPMLAAGDHLFLQAAYADGALGYLGWSGQFGVGRIASADSDEQLRVADLYTDAFGNTKSSSGWSVVAALRHFWTPTLRSDLVASYSELKLGYTNGLGVGLVSRPLDPKELIVAGNLVWSPVSGLDIGVEVLYTRTDLRQPVLAVDNSGARVGPNLVKSDDAWAGRLRIQRDF